MRVTYAGPYAAVEVDGVRIERGQEANLTADQFERVKHRGVWPVGEASPVLLRVERTELTPEAIAAKTGGTALVETEAPGNVDEGGREAEEVV